ncbi:MAG: chalcone isomerase family protein [Pseudobdellovibrio sp.]
MKKMLFTIVMVSSVFAQAALLTYEAGTQTLNGINLNKTAAINDSNGAPTDLKMDLLGAGLRTKTVLVVEAKVYTAQLFSDNKAAYSRNSDTALTSLVTNSTRVALRLDMLRTVSASSLVTSFKEALDANNIALDAELTNVLDLMQKSADATSGKSITMLMVKDVKNGNKTNLYYEDTKGVLKSVTTSPELMGKILAIWLGKPADDGLAALKTQLLKAVY